MSIDLQMLALAAVLIVVLALPYTVALIAVAGPVQTMSYPQPSDECLPDWAKRSKRAHLNMVENIAPFAILVLVAHVSGNANATTGFGAQLFIYARLVQAIAHTFAIPFVRTISWFASLGGLVIILTQLF
jgi:uncharacterized MAPEG superfamily protein